MFFEMKSAFESKRVCKFHFVLFRVADFGLRIQSELHSCFLIQKMMLAIFKLRVVSFWSIIILLPFLLSTSEIQFLVASIFYNKFLKFVVVIFFEFPILTNVITFILFHFGLLRFCFRVRPGL